MPAKAAIRRKILFWAYRRLPASGIDSSRAAPDTLSQLLMDERRPLYEQEAGNSGSGRLAARAGGICP